MTSEQGSGQDGPSESWGLGAGEGAEQEDVSAQLTGPGSQWVQEPRKSRFLGTQSRAGAGAERRP